MSWQDWWVWAAGALVLGILETLAPGYVFLGFCFGAGAVAGVLLFGGPLAAVLAGSLPLTVLTFAALSLVAWIVMRQVMGVRKGQVKTWERDINED